MADSGIRGLRHLALKVTDLARSRKFYEELFGMKVVWEPDLENVYLSSGPDNLALHQIPAADVSRYRTAKNQLLDHLGFIMDSTASVDRLLAQAERFGATIVKPAKQHRDGSYSFYMTDPDGNVVQVLYEPAISKLKLS
ncbi:MAG TPA: VOC family protein [Nitrospiraceae bacterium]|nr:VOC family protein [Nitrospiraceae bacterium]